jgi:hypothetical protein
MVHSEESHLINTQSSVGCSRAAMHFNRFQRFSGLTNPTSSVKRPCTNWTWAALVLLSWDWFSAAADFTTQVRADAVARTNGASVQMFSTYTDAPKFVRNPAFWLRGMNGLTGIHAGGGPGATAITPWHIVGANHWKNSAGSKVVFCDAENKAITRTVVDGVEIRPDIKSDIWLAVLDSALPPSIVPMAMMPTNWLELIPPVRLPVAALNRDQCFGSAELLPFREPARGWFQYGLAFKRSSALPTMQFEPRKGGDSGRPVVTFVRSNLVLVSHLTLEGGGVNFFGPDYGSYGPDIQAAIRTLGTNDSAKAQHVRIVNLNRGD